MYGVTDLPFVILYTQRMLQEQCCMQFIKKLMDAKTSIKVFELEEDIISKKINNLQSIKLAVSA